MKTLINKENIQSSYVTFDPATNPVSPDAHWPSISEMVAEARKTGQMPFSNLRTPVPSYTDDIDTPQGFDSTDKVEAAMNARAFADKVSEMETTLEELKAKEKQEKDKAEPVVPESPKE